jgi:hypothetical protein
MTENTVGSIVLCRCGHERDRHGSRTEMRRGEKVYVQKCESCPCEVFTDKDGPLSRMIDSFQPMKLGRVPPAPSAETKDEDHCAGLIHQVASPLVETEPRPNMTRQAADFIAVSFKGRIKELARAADAKPTYEGDYAPAVCYYASACDEARALLQKRLDALDQIGSGTPSSQRSEPVSAQERSAKHETLESADPSVERGDPQTREEMLDRLRNLAMKNAADGGLNNKDVHLRYTTRELAQALYWALHQLQNTTPSLPAPPLAHAEGRQP